MQRAIERFDVDEVGDWVAFLVCGHRQHVRHKPPFFSRPWAATAEGREAMIGQPLECVRCDRLELPEGMVAYDRTRIFDEASTPAGLLRDHRTRARVWGLIQVLEGRLRFVLDSLDGRVLWVDPEHPAAVPPELVHHVELTAGVRFFVEFYSADGRRP